MNLLSNTNNKSSKKNNNGKSSNKSLITAAAVMVILIAGFFVFKVFNGGSSNSVSASGDLVIPKSDISDTAKFYKYKVGNTAMEVVAVKASDGTIRTAFNTCQVCFDSGRGYYKQEGNELVCQNCGNRFNMDQVEKIKGGCNPVPIMSTDKTEDGTNITISGTFLAQNKQLFGNWKR